MNSRSARSLMWVLVTWFKDVVPGWWYRRLPARQRALLLNWRWHCTHWGRVTLIFLSKLTIMGSDNGLSPDRCQAIIWTNAGILLNRTLGTNLSEILIETFTFSSKNTHLNMSSEGWRPFSLDLNVFYSKNWKKQLSITASMFMFPYDFILMILRLIGQSRHGKSWKHVHWWLVWWLRAPRVPSHFWSQ